MRLFDFAHIVSLCVFRVSLWLAKLRRRRVWFTPANSRLIRRKSSSIAIQAVFSPVGVHLYGKMLVLDAAE